MAVRMIDGDCGYESQEFIAIKRRVAKSVGLRHLVASFATSEPCECMQMVRFTRRVAVSVVGLSHGHE